MPVIDSPSTTAQRAPDLAAFVAQSCGVLTVAIGVSALIGWITGIEALHRINVSFVPTAPSTALALVLLGAAAFALERWPERRGARAFVISTEVFVCALAALVIAQSVGGFDLGLEAEFSSAAQTFQGVRAGKMSPISAGGFLLAALSLVALTTYASETVAGRRVAVGLVCGTLVIGLATLTGYALGAPLLYHSVVIPVALPTATGLSLLGVAILTTAVRGPRRGAVGAAEARRSKRPRIMRYLPAALGAGATALLALEAAGIIRQLDQTRLQETFDSNAWAAAAALASDMDESLTSLRSMGTSIEIDNDFTRQDFRALAAASLPRHGGISALAWVPRVPLEMRARFETEVQRDGRPDFRVRERGPAGRLVAAGHRNEYFPVSDVKPSASYERLLGFDVATDPAVAGVLERARDAAAPSASEPFTLVADTSGRVTVMLVQPVYFPRPSRSAVAERGDLHGFAVGIVPFADVARPVDTLLKSQGIALTLRDIGQGGEAEPLHGRPQVGQASRLRAHAETLSVADRRWEATFVATAAYPALHRQWSAWALLAGGLFFAFLVGRHLYGMERYTSDLETARETLHESEARFRAISESAADCIITIDGTGTIVHCNAAAARAFGYDNGGLLGRNVRDIIPPSHVAAHSAGLAQYVATGQALVVGEVLELPALRRDGEEFPIEMTLSVWETGDGRFATAILRDISERKRSREEREQLIAKLQDALASVKTLSGLMPICAWCKKIRDDQGYWTQLESYLSDHTTAEFSHGMCPDCEKKFGGGEVG